MKKKLFIITMIFLSMSLLYAETFTVEEKVNWINFRNTNVNVDGNLIKTSITTSWDADAISSQTIEDGEDGFIKINIVNSSIYMIGFENNNNNANYTSLNYATYIHSNGYHYIYEFGVYKGQFGTYNIGDVFEMKRIGTTITYYKNNNLYYTSGTASTGALFIDTSLHSGSPIIDATIGYKSIPEPITGILLAISIIAFIFFRKK